MAKYLYDKSENKLSIHSFSPYSQEYLNKLSEKYRLNELCADCKSDYEKVLCVTKWVSNLWEHDGNNLPERFEPDFILDEVINNGKRFRCVEYGIVIYGCLNALNIRGCVKTLIFAFLLVKKCRKIKLFSRQYLIFLRFHTV